MKLRERIRAIDKELSTYINAALLLAVQYADAIAKAVNDNLPSLQPYLTPTVYQTVGLAVVVFNIVRAARAVQTKVG